MYEILPFFNSLNHKLTIGCCRLSQNAIKCTAYFFAIILAYLTVSKLFTNQAGNVFTKKKKDADDARSNKRNNLLMAEKLHPYCS